MQVAAQARASALTVNREGKAEGSNFFITMFLFVIIGIVIGALLAS